MTDPTQDGPERPGTGSRQHSPGAGIDGLLAVAANFSAAELINHAADLSAASSVLTHENERRWRIFHERIEQITAPG